VRYANRAGRIGGFDIRHLLNGFIDRYIYSAGLVDNTLPFEELRRRSRINDAALAADDTPDFSQRIRASLPRPRPLAWQHDHFLLQQQPRTIPWSKRQFEQIGEPIFQPMLFGRFIGY
jgi:hypothetical protein